MEGRISMHETEGGTRVINRALGASGKGAALQSSGVQLGSLMRIQREVK